MEAIVNNQVKLQVHNYTRNAYYVYKINIHKTIVGCSSYLHEGSQGNHIRISKI